MLVMKRRETCTKSVSWLVDVWAESSKLVPLYIPTMTTLKPCFIWNESYFWYTNTLHYMITAAYSPQLSWVIDRTLLNHMFRSKSFEIQWAKWVCGERERERERRFGAIWRHQWRKLFLSIIEWFLLEITEAWFQSIMDGRAGVLLCSVPNNRKETCFSISNVLSALLAPSPLSSTMGFISVHSEKWYAARAAHSAMLGLWSIIYLSIYRRTKVHILAINYPEFSNHRREPKSFMTSLARWLTVNATS